MNTAELKKLARRYLGDLDGKVWNDLELEEMIRVAARRYSEDAACYHRMFNFCVDETGKYRYPSDFIAFLVGWNDEGREIAAGTERKIPWEEIEKVGSPRYIYDDLSGPGEFRLAPDPKLRQQRTSIGVETWGEVAPTAFGVVDRGFGVVKGAVGYNFAGDAAYIRYADAEEIRDHLALLYHVLNQAHNTDAELANPAYGRWYLERYRERVALLAPVRHKNAGQARPGNFF